MITSYINTLRPAVMTDTFCVEGAILVPQKVVNSIYNIIIPGKMLTTELLFQ